MKNSRAMLFVAMVVAIASVSLADPITIMDPTTRNGSFEDPVVAGEVLWAVTPQASWVQGDEGAVYTYHNAAYAAQGDQMIEILSNTDPLNNTGVQIVSGNDFTLSGYVWPDLWNFSVEATTSISLIATENSDGTGAAVTLLTISHTATAPGAYTYVSGSTGEVDAGVVGYYLQVAPDSTGATWCGVDNIVVTSDVVPEPASIALIVAGGAGLLIRRKRRS